jgi:hypothetical protein
MPDPSIAMATRSIHSAAKVVQRKPSRSRRGLVGLLDVSYQRMLTRMEGSLSTARSLIKREATPLHADLHGG